MPPSPPCGWRSRSRRRLIDYRVVPVTSGADAMAEVNVVVQVGERTYAGTVVEHRRGGGLGRGVRPGTQQVLVCPRRHFGRASG